MPLSPRLMAATAILAAAAAATGSAVLLANWVEARSRTEVQAALDQAALDWATVEVDGLQVILTGTAPDEVLRSRALSAAAGVVDPARVIDDLATAAGAEIPAPRYALEILQGDGSISLIGLVPETSREGIGDSLKGGLPLSDMLDTATHPAPEGWDAALRFGLAAVRALPRSKISITADRVVVTGSTDSVAARQAAEAALDRMRPAGLPVEMRITAPRPVVTPFALRYAAEEGLTACTADTEAALARIRAAAGGPEAECLLALGTPSPQWAEAAEAAIAAVRALDSGEVTLSDADVTLAAGPTTTLPDFDRVAAALKSTLPAPFVLSLLRPEPTAEIAAGPAEFDAALTGGKVRLQGRFLDDRQRQTTLAYAQSRFGVPNVALEAETSAAIPEGWGLRVLAGLEALSRLSDGQVSVRPELVSVTGVSGRAAAPGEIARALADRLGGGAAVRISVRYDKALDPAAGLPTPQECVARLNAILQGHKVTFAPGSATIESSAAKTLDAVAQAMRPCIDVRMEIGGHTDSQGRDETNLQLSQARAEAVLESLLARRVPVGNLSARGYGETQPVAENRTEDGREANRRIEFKLILPGGGVAAPAASPEAGPSTAPAAIPAPRARPVTATAPEPAPPEVAPEDDAPPGAEVAFPPLEEENLETGGEATDGSVGEVAPDDAPTDLPEGGPPPEAPAPTAPASGN